MSLKQVDAVQSEKKKLENTAFKGFRVQVIGGKRLRVSNKDKKVKFFEVDVKVTK